LNKKSLHEWDFFVLSDNKIKKMTETTSKTSKQSSRNKKTADSKTGNSYFPLILIIVSFVLQFSFYSFDEGEYGIRNNLFGIVGHYISKTGFYLFGKAIYLLALLGFLSGTILLQKRDANKNRIFLSYPFLILSLSIFLHIIGNSSSNLRGLEGNKIGGLFSQFFEFVLGKSGRVLVALGFGFYGLICLLKESPKKIDIEFWKKIIIISKEKLLSSVSPDVDASPEPPTETKNSKDIPWIEVKKVGVSRKIPQVSDFSMKPIPIDTMTVPHINTVSFQDLEIKTEPESIRIQELKHSIQKLKKEIDAEEKKVKEKGIVHEEALDPEIYFKEVSRDLKSKIFKSPIPIPIQDLDESLPNEPEEVENLDKQVLQELWEARDPDLISSIDDSVTEDEMTELLSPENEDINEPLEDYVVQINSPILEPEEYYPTPPLPDELKPEIRETKLPFSSSVPPVEFLKKTAYRIPTKLFSTNPQKRSDPMFKLEAEYIAKKIIEIIKEYGYDSKIVAWQKGPIVTRFELSPPPGVKLSRITSLSDELRLYLAVKSIRIVAPIPGKSTIGIEVPNKYRENVHLGDILREKGEELPSTMDLNIVLGKDSISGETISIDLTKLPHLLVAGTTGSGKSVSMNAMISYLIYSKSPEEVRFIMIDPKMVEMSLYENIPHLLLPVITDPRKATKALLWAVQEMEARYALISDLKCRDIRGYNEKVGSSLIARLRHKKMPYIVIFIDELSDLMMVSGKELEDYIIRISQKARAVGIHLVMATQRPSVDVITGIIKANCPARMAFHVAQKNDSKIILDYSGADTLLGKGDFLYKSPTSADLQRIQAPFVTEEEIEKIVQESMTYAKAEYVSMNLDEESFKEDENDADEETFDKAWNIVKTERKASASYLQRRLRIGYNKAARIMELMEERGYVGPQIGAKPREILR
jgi:DNA segregation ATPase FtsK/SpoIIIE, S-DNA-T family